MEILLIVAVIVITLAVLAQAGALIAMYLMSRQLSVKAESLMNDSRRLIPPLESVLSNLKTAMEDLTETAKITREQALLIQDIISETHDSVRKDIDEVRERVVGKVEQYLHAPDTGMVRAGNRHHGRHPRVLQAKEN